MIGLSVAGLGLVAQESMRGIMLGGLATVAGDDIAGFTLGGLAVVSGGAITGITAGGLAVVADREITGLTASLGAVETSGRVAGITTALYRIKAPSVRGFDVAGWLKTRRLEGMSIAAFNQVRGVQRGLAIGVFNTADELHGIQIGILNRAGNNKPPFRWLPVFNAHFGK
jgi:hypothetical protein